MALYTIINAKKEMNKITNFRITKSMGNAIDTFSVSFANPHGAISPQVYLADTLYFLKDQTEIIFSGFVETKNSVITESDSRFTVTGRDEICNLFETSAKFNTYKNISDNDIITKLVEESGVYLDLSLLSNPSMISEYTIGPGDTVGNVIKGLAEMNGFSIWTKGKKLIKGKLKETGNPVKIYDIQSIGNQAEIMSISMHESIRDSKTEIRGYSTNSDKEKSQLQSTMIVPNFGTTSYFQQKLRKVNGHGGSTARFRRIQDISLASKNLGDLQREMEFEARRRQVVGTIDLVTKGFQDLELNDIIGLKYHIEGIDNTFVVTGLTYNLDNTGEQTTDISLTYKGAYPQ